jgi:hypothetical protein
VCIVSKTQPLGGQQKEKLMLDVAKRAYEKVSIGGTGWIRPDPDKGETVEGFQSVPPAADQMQKEGLILIRSVHHESSSGRSLIDAIQFERLK